MNVVLATMLMMVQGTGHNIERLPRALPTFEAGLSGPGESARYAYDQDGCTTRPSGAIVCRRRHGR